MGAGAAGLGRRLPRIRAQHGALVNQVVVRWRQLRRSSGAAAAGADAARALGTVRRVVADGTGGAGHAAAANFLLDDEVELRPLPCVGLRLRGAPAPPYLGRTTVS